jgi:hypothetical protein
MCHDEDILTLVAEFALNHFNPLILKCQDMNVSAEFILNEFSKLLVRITGNSTDGAFMNFKNPIIIPVYDLAKPFNKSNTDTYYLLPVDDVQMTGINLPQKKDLENKLDHILFSSYCSGFHTDYPVISELIAFQFKIPCLSIRELIKLCTINPARALKMDNQLGTFETGKAPGINLITNVDFNKMKLTEKSELKVIV